MSQRNRNSIVAAVLCLLWALLGAHPRARADDVVAPLALPTATPIGTLLPSAPKPRVSGRGRSVRVSIKDTVSGNRDYYVVLVRVRNEELISMRRVRMNLRRGQTVFRDLPAGTIRAYTSVHRSSRTGVRSLARSRFITFKVVDRSSPGAPQHLHR